MCVCNGSYLLLPIILLGLSCFCKSSPLEILPFAGYDSGEEWIFVVRVCQGGVQFRLGRVSLQEKAQKMYFIENSVGLKEAVRGVCYSWLN